jgi:ParB-like chromosome segregation protein Spo0J
MYSWRIETRKIKDLKKNPKNPRTLTAVQSRFLQNSIDRFGLIDKPVINIDNQIIGGHQRIALLKKDGAEEVECWVPDKEVTENDLSDLNLMLNRIHGEFDYDILANEFDLVNLIECGFTVDELQIGDVDECETEEKKKKSKTCPHCGEEL